MRFPRPGEAETLGPHLGTGREPANRWVARPSGERQTGWLRASGKSVPDTWNERLLRDISKSPAFVTRSAQPAKVWSLSTGALTGPPVHV